MRNIGVYVLHWGGENGEHDRLTVQCVESWIDEARQIGAAVTVIDNGSPKAFDKPHQWADVNVLRLENNLPLIDAFNVGIKNHACWYVICVTNDTLKPDGVPLLAGLADVLERERVGICAPGTNDAGGGTLHVTEALGKADHDTRHVDNVVWAWNWGFLGLPRADGHTHRACWYSNKEFCWRARRDGLRVVAATGSAYVHHLNTGGNDREAHEHGERWLKNVMGENYHDAW